MAKFSLVRHRATTTELFKPLQVVIPLMRNQDRALAPAMQHTLPVHDPRRGRGVVAVSE